MSDEIEKLARRALEAEQQELCGEVSGSGLLHWRFVIYGLWRKFPASLQTLSALTDEELQEFLMAPHENNDVWEEYMTLSAAWEEIIDRSDV
jgi:hypothetical protein